MAIALVARLSDVVSWQWQRIVAYADFFRGKPWD